MSLEIANVELREQCWKLLSALAGVILWTIGVAWATQVVVWC